MFTNFLQYVKLTSSTPFQHKKSTALINTAISESDMYLANCCRFDILQSICTFIAIATGSYFFCIIGRFVKRSNLFNIYLKNNKRQIISVWSNVVLFSRFTCSCASNTFLWNELILVYSKNMNYLEIFVSRNRKDEEIDSLHTKTKILDKQSGG